MKETPQQYIARILAYSDGKDPMMVLSTTAARLRTWIDTVPAERWRERPAEDRWSAAEILAHLADVEIVTGWRVRSILAEDAVELQAFDQDVWADAFRYQKVDLQEALQTFTALRSSLVALLQRVDQSRLEHHGMHAERGKETIAHLMRLYAGHDLNHLSQIEGLLGRGSQ
jgi:uncharacterized damage-inducible protein DinB